MAQINATRGGCVLGGGGGKRYRVKKPTPQDTDRSVRTDLFQLKCYQFFEDLLKMVLVSRSRSTVLEPKMMGHVLLNFPLLRSLLGL